MGSTRLPGKVFMQLSGRPVLWHVVERLKHSKRLKGIVVATTSSPADDIICDFCKKNSIDVFRGSEADVLDRYYRCAKDYNADPVVRVTADCPVIDPEIVDEVIGGFFEGGYEVYSLGGEFPDGLDCECFSFSALEDAWKNATLPSEREHVGVFMQRHPARYRIGVYERFKGLGHHRWTLDEESDYLFLTEVYNRLFSPERIFLTDDILKLLNEEPWIQKINSGITRNEGFLKSLLEDKRYMEDKGKGESW